MFCGEVPCACNVKDKPAPKIRVPRKSAVHRPEVVEASTTAAKGSAAEKTDLQGAMRAAAKIHHKGATVKEDHDAVDEMAAIRSDPELSAAVRALGPLMHPTERRRFQEVLESEPEVSERALVWRRKVNGE
jgi:hypothetical protein